jgi:Asp-tRNA(Asn)/Glu-tRNA(Gln) amidotransferase A subunit family amidase
MMNYSLDIVSLRQSYLDGKLKPLAVMENILSRIGEDPHQAWIYRLPIEAIREYAFALQGKDPASLPLYGIPFAIKDNIDLAGAPTTAGCPEFAYHPQRHASVVQRLIDAGAIPIGKTVPAAMRSIPHTFRGAPVRGRQCLSRWVRSASVWVPIPQGQVAYLPPSITWLG